MPPLFTSTSWTTLVRKVATAMIYTPKPASAVAFSSKKPSLNNIHKTRKAINQIIQSSFPSLSTPSHQLNYATIPIKSSSRQFSSSANATSRFGKGSSSSKLGPVRQGLQSNGSRPKWVNGLSIQANVGLGSARTFASSTHQVVNNNIPIVFRAFASLIDDENKKSYGQSLPKPSRYTPYSKSRLNRKQRITRRTSCYSIDSSFIEDLKHYFPISIRSNSNEEVCDERPLLLEPELLVTEGKTTVLALPLSPSLDELLSNSMSSNKYSEISVGISILSNLTKGLLSIHNSFSLHSSTRIIPLLNKLDNLGILDYHPGNHLLVETEVSNDPITNQPDILRLIFNNRSVSDIRTILGESLRLNEEGQWWALYEIYSETPKRLIDLTQVERKEIMEEWGSPIIKPTLSRVQSEQLVFPTLDMSVTQPPQEEEDENQVREVIFDFSESSSESESWPSSGTDTPYPIDSPLSESIVSTLSTSPNESLTASLLSRLSESQNEQTGIWSIYPSDSDSDIESAFSEFEEWNRVDQMLTPAIDNENDVSDEVIVTWSGSGQGFGFLAQPW
ncbi:uncharacterized protein L201_002561 [Kwoniella dendrophila CBS 6074]|uniref:Uncharacterized protein n=1 Tax=Kwoniella dendrophila CBS 6074 TaxID=1295534 RepID=A0AAX4JQH7_9TREE